MMYDYRKTVKADVKAWLADNFEFLEDSVDDTTDREEVYDFMSDVLWAEDSVTGNSSGSYTCNAYEAKVYVKENLMLALEALKYFGYDANAWDNAIENESWEYLDVTIRCYLLSDAINEVIDEAEELRKA